MKFLAILQIVCLMFLSAYIPAKAETHNMKQDCCNRMKKAGACKSDKKAGDDCNSQRCNLMLTCSICGFLIQQPVKLQAAAFITLKSPLSKYQMGDATGYSTSDWKPPKV